MDALQEALAHFAEGHTTDVRPEAFIQRGRLLFDAVREHVLGGEVPDGVPPVLVGGFRVLATFPVRQRLGSMRQDWLVIIRTELSPLDMNKHDVGYARYDDKEQEWQLREDCRRQDSLTRQVALALYTRWAADDAPNAQPAAQPGPADGPQFPPEMLEALVAAAGELWDNTHGADRYDVLSLAQRETLDRAAAVYRAGLDGDMEGDEDGEARA